MNAWPKHANLIVEHDSDLDSSIKLGKNKIFFKLLITHTNQMEMIFLEIELKYL